MARNYGSAPVSAEEERVLRKFGRDRRDPEQKTKDSDPYPSTKEVQDAHRNASVDTRTTDIHHTLGSRPTQASPGNHVHNGSDAPLLLQGVSITGSKGGNAAVASIISALTRLGATDNTT